MARVLCVWEQGANLGHLTNLRLPIEVALQAGHQVFVAARQLHEFHGILGDLPITCLPAPFKQNALGGGQEAFLSYTHLLRRQCFSTAGELQTYLRAWHALFALVQPDLVLFEHSPTALIAAHGHPFKKVLVGVGFSSPPGLAGEASAFLPFPTTALTAPVLDRLRSDDVQLLQLINQALRAVQAPPLADLQAIYRQADASLLTTWEQFDHFGPRSPACYIGVQPPPRQAPPVWPSGTGPKVFGYLGAMPSLEALLQGLQAAGVCALLLVRDLPDALRQRYSSAQMQFIDRAVDLDAVARQAAWVVNNSNHGSVVHFAQHGVPQLLIPLHQEQLFLALRMVQRGAAAMAYQDQPVYTAALDAMQNHMPLRQQAQLLAAELTPYAALDSENRIRQTLARLLA